MRDMSKVYDLLNPIAKEDLFISSLIKMSKKVRDQKNIKQTGYLGVLRTDYMITEQNEPKLVELNTISVGMFGFSDQMKSFYEYMADKHLDIDIPALPSDSNNIENIAAAMISAHNLFLSVHDLRDKKPIICFIVDEIETLICDHKLLENYMYSRYKVFVRRLTFEDILTH